MNIDIMSCFTYNFYVSGTVLSVDISRTTFRTFSYLYLISEIACNILHINIDKHSEVLGSITLCEHEDGQNLITNLSSGGF